MLYQKRFDRHVNNENCISDIYDGEQYKKYSQPGSFLLSAYPANISFTFNTDGVILNPLQLKFGVYGSV